MTTKTAPDTEPHDEEKEGGDPDVLTDCLTQTRQEERLDFDPIGIEPLDPLAKDCPDDLPCRVQDSELWFADAPADLDRAKAFCRQCPAIVACLAGALERGEPWGVWGGEIFERGVIVARKRPRGRPRKQDAPQTVGAEAGTAPGTEARTAGRVVAA